MTQDILNRSSIAVQNQCISGVAGVTNFSWAGCFTGFVHVHSCRQFRHDLPLDPTGIWLSDYQDFTLDYISHSGSPSQNYPSIVRYLGCVISDESDPYFRLLP